MFQCRFQRAAAHVNRSGHGTLGAGLKLCSRCFAKELKNPERLSVPGRPQVMKGLVVEYRCWRAYPEFFGQPRCGPHDLSRLRPDPVGGRGGVAHRIGNLQRAQLALARLGQRGDDIKCILEAAKRFRIGAPFVRGLSGLEPLVSRLLRVAGAGKVVGKNFGCYPSIRLHDRGERGVELLPLCAKQSGISGVLNQDMFKRVNSVGCGAARKY